MNTSLVRAGLICGATVLTLATHGCGYSSTDGGGGNQNPVATSEVTVHNGSFSPSAIIVSPGTTVTWTWGSSLRHNVTFASDEIPDSPDQTSGDFQAVMPNTPGTYTYRCTIHGFRGSVVVQ